MKVIVEGKLPTFEGVCKICGCVVSAFRKEYTLYRTIQGEHMVICCPTKHCDNIITLYPK